MKTKITISALLVAGFALLFGGCTPYAYDRRDDRQHYRHDRWDDRYDRRTDRRYDRRDRWD